MKSTNLASTILFSTILLSTMALLSSPAAAWAQRDAASKIDGAAYEAPYFYSSLGTYQDNAYSHAVVLREATSGGEALPKAIAKEHIDPIRANLAAASKHHARLRKATKSNTQTAAHLNEIEAHHKKALALTTQLDAACASGKGDAAAVNKLAAGVSDELKAAGDKHRKIAQQTSNAKPAKARSK